MDTEDKIKALEDEFQVTKSDLQRILLDIRAFLMEADTPLRGELNEGRLPDGGDTERGA